MLKQTVAQIRFTRQTLALVLALFTLRACTRFTVFALALAVVAGSALVLSPAWLSAGATSSLRAVTPLGARMADRVAQNIASWRRADHQPPAAAARPVSPVREAIARKLQTQAKVKVELFVMSQCPFGVRAEEAMAPVLKEFGARMDFQLRFIATPTGDGFTSMHGQPEVDEDLRQTVMAAQFPQQYFDYVVARASDYRNAAWQPAAIAAGMEVAAVEGFARSEAGRRLFAENIRRANELHITASPTILLDGEKYTGKILPALAAATAYSKTGTTVAPSALNATAEMACTQASDCNDNNACTIDACDPTTGSCSNTQLICDDSNACTRDTCDPAQGCVYTPINCDDGDPNTADSCNSTKGCVNTPCPTITVTNPTTTTGALGVAFSQQFTQAGGSVNTTFSTSSTLPNGLTLAPNGTLSGIPTQNGAFPLTVTATDNNSCTSTGTTYNLNITCVTNPVVTSTADSGAGSLRDVIAQACPDSTITFANGLGTITLTSGELLIGKKLTIQGPGANLLTVNNTAAASPTSRLFKINAGATVTLSGLTLSGGNVLIDDNSLADVGGSAIRNRGNLTIRNCVITSNQHAFTGIRVGVSEAGAVYNQGILNVISSLIFGNSANKGTGGGIFNIATANLINSTISSNSSRSSQINTPGAGGGIYNSGVLNLINCTVAFNTADVYGGIYTANARTTIKNSITASNTGSNTSLGSDYYGPIGSLGNNIIGNTNGIGDSLGTFPASGDWQNQDPLLMPLNNNGGPTATHALSPDSPALNAGSTPAEIQFVTIFGISGSFTLTFDGQATSPLPVGASAATVQAALNNLASIGGVGGAVTVTGTRAGNNGSRIFTIEFGGSLASTNQPQITAAATGGATVNGIGTALEGDAFPTTDQRGPGFPRQVGSAIDIGAFEVQNNAPTLTLNPTAPSLSQGSQQTAVALGSVNDVESAVGGLQVSITSTNPSNGVTLSQFTNNNGLLSATIQAACNASNASFTLAVTDEANAVTTAHLNVTVTANTAPAISYPPNPGAVFGSGLSVNPQATPSDNGSITSFQVFSIVPALASGITVNSAGVVTVANTIPANTYTVTIRATDNCGLSKDASFTLGIVKATPTITWSNPADVPYGTALSATQLNATASVEGSFSYNPPSGTVLNAGNGQLLTANFTPRDTANFNSASKQVLLHVLKAPLTVTVNNAFRNQGEANPPFSGSIIGLKNGDVITASYSTTATVGSAPGNYPIIATLNDPGNRLGNYQVTNTPGTLKVFNSCGLTILPFLSTQATLGQFYAQPLNASPLGLYSFSLFAGSLPPGLTLVNNFGQYLLQGTPTTSGTFSFTLLVRNTSNTCESIHRYTMTIAPTVVPKVTCKTLNPNGSYTVQFGYENSTGAAVTIPVGANNTFTSGSANRGQTTVFQPGVVNNAFSVTFATAGAFTGWSLKGPDGVLRGVVPSVLLPNCP